MIKISQIIFQNEQYQTWDPKSTIKKNWAPSYENPNEAPEITEVPEYYWSLCTPEQRYYASL